MAADPTSTGPAPFTELADGPCAGADELLLSLAAEFWPVDAGATRGRGSTTSRAGCSARQRSRPPTARTCSAPCSSDELGLAPEQGPDPRAAAPRPAPAPAPRAPAGDRRARRRAAAPRRRRRPRCARRPPAGSSGSAPAASGRCCSTRGSAADDDPCPSRVRRHCAHEVAFCVLTGLAERFARADRREPGAPRARAAAGAARSTSRSGARCGATSTRSARPRPRRPGGAAAPRRSRPGGAS